MDPLQPSAHTHDSSKQCPKAVRATRDVSCCLQALAMMTTAITGTGATYTEADW